MQKGKNANYQNENLIYKLLSIDDMENTVKKIKFYARKNGRRGKIYENLWQKMMVEASAGELKDMRNTKTK